MFKAAMNSGLMVYVVIFSIIVMSTVVQASESIISETVGDKSHVSVATSNNKALASLYFTEIIDKGRVDQVPVVFADNAVQIFLGNPVIKGTANISTGIQRLLSNTKTIRTEILTMIEQGDTVMCHVRHVVTGGKAAVFKNRPQIHPPVLSVDGKTFSWEAMVLFKFNNGKAVEEIIIRDELGMLMQLGSVKVEQNISR